MTRIGVITNPRSRRNKGNPAAIRAAVEAHRELLHAELEDISALPEVLRDFAAREVGVIVVNGGDGTVHAVLTELFVGGPFASPPALAVLGRGMSNMIAGDVGLAERSPKTLARLAGLARDDGLEGHMVERPVMRLELGPGEPVRYGMFFGTAAIYRAIQTSRSVYQPLGITDPLASGLTLLTVMVRRLWSGGRPDAFFRGDPIAVGLDGARPEDGSYLVLLATTLERLVLGSRPYWGEESGAIHFTAVAFPPPRFLYHGTRLMFGHHHGDLPPAYVSHNVATLSLAMACPFALDGEIFEPRPDSPIRLDAAERIRFVRT